MSDAATLVDALLGVGKAVLPMVVPGSAQAIATAEKVIELIDHTKEAFDGKTDLTKLNATRDELEKRVNEQVNATIDHLRG